MKKLISAKNLSIILCLVFVGLVFVTHNAEAAANSNGGYWFQCSRHGHNDAKDCGYSGNQYFPPANYWGAATSFQFLGHRHGSSSITAAACLTTTSGGGRCQWYQCNGDGCGYEYGGENPWDYRDSGYIYIDVPLGARVYTFQYARVMDAEVAVSGSADAYYNPPIYGCTDRGATNYNLSANTDDGSCNYVVTVACVIRDTSNRPIGGATCSIAGQSGTTNGDGYRAFNGVRIGTQTLGVSASGYNSYSGSYQISRNTDLIVNLTSSCAGNTGGSCSSSPNACGQRNTGTIQCNGSCSASPPANPPGYGNTCSSPANSCGQSNSGTIQCNGSCSASTPPNPAGYGSACSATNACGQSNSGTIQCNGSCSASAPPNPGNYGSACSSSANTCGQTNSGTIQCNGSCSASTPGNPAGYGNACTSANACGQRNSGTIQCNGSCSALPPANPGSYGSACSSPANACGQSNSGTIQCNGSCSASTPPNSSCPYSLSTSINSGSGTISGPGISCPGDCSEIYLASTWVTLIATPSPDFIFKNWSAGAGTICGGQGSICSALVDGAKTALANFNAVFNYRLSSPSTSNVEKTSGNAFTQNTITKTLIAGDTEPVTLSLSGVPSGVSYAISNGTCSPNCTSVITFTVTPSTPVGTHTITVSGSTLGKQTSFSLVVSGNPMTVTCSASPTTSLMGQTVTWTANVSGGTPPLRYLWSGTNIPTNPAPTSTPYSITYNTIGQKTATVTVTDADALQTTCPASVVQVNFDPNFEEF